MTQPEYEQNRAECWEYVSKTILTIGGSKEKRAFDYAFDRAYALGKLQASCRQVNKIISQEEIEKAALKYVFNRQKARHNAKNDEEAYLSDFDNTLKAWDAFDMAQAYEDGANFALGKQEKDAEESSLWSRLTDEEKRELRCRYHTNECVISNHRKLTGDKAQTRAVARMRLLESLFGKENLKTNNND